MLKIVAATLIILGTAAPAQVITSYQTSTPAPVEGDANKIVCQKEERIGTRLGVRKLCLTVSEWKERERLHRHQTDRMQAGGCVPQTLSSAPGSCVKGPYGD